MTITTYPPTREVVLFGDTAARVQDHMEVKQDLAATAGEALTECLRLRKQQIEMAQTILDQAKDVVVLREKLERCRWELTEASFFMSSVGFNITGIRKTLKETQP